MATEYINATINVAFYLKKKKKKKKDLKFASEKWQSEGL